MSHRSRGIRLLALLVVLPCALVLLFAQTASAQSEDPWEQLDQTRRDLQILQTRLEQAQRRNEAAQKGDDIVERITAQQAVVGLERDIEKSKARERQLEEQVGLRQPEPAPVQPAPPADSTEGPSFLDGAEEIFWAGIDAAWYGTQEQLAEIAAKTRPNDQAAQDHLADVKAKRQAAERRLRELTGQPEPAPNPADPPAGTETTPAEATETPAEPGATGDGQTGDGGNDGQPTAEPNQQSLEDLIIGDTDLGTEPGVTATPVPGGEAAKVGTPAVRPDDPEIVTGEPEQPTTDDGRSNMSTEPIPGFGGGPNGNGPCTLPASLRVFCPPGLEGPPATDLPDIFTEPPTNIGKPNIFVPPPDDLPGKSGGRTGGGTTDGGLGSGVLPGGQSGPCPGGKDILVTCPIGEPDGTGSTIRLGTGTVTLDPKTKGDLSDLFDKPDTNPYATAAVPVGPFTPGLLLPKVGPAQTLIDLDTAAGPTLFGSLDTFTLDGTGGSDGLGAGDSQIGGGGQGDNQPPEGDQGENQDGDCQASDTSDCPSEVPAAGTGAVTGVAGEAVGGVGEGAASSVGGGAGQPGTVEPDAGVTDEQVTTPPAGAATEAPIVCDPGVPC
jgi:hypothetical protein